MSSHQITHYWSAQVTPFSSLPWAKLVEWSLVMSSRVSRVVKHQKQLEILIIRLLWATSTSKSPKVLQLTIQRKVSQQWLWEIRKCKIRKRLFKYETIVCERLRLLAPELSALWLILHRVWDYKLRFAVCSAQIECAENSTTVQQVWDIYSTRYGGRGGDGDS